MDHFTQLLANIDTLQRCHKTLLVGIDGCGGSGKSTVASKLARARTDVTIVAMYDFYLPAAIRPSPDIAVTQIGTTFDWDRLYRQALEPLNRDTVGQYQTYDWHSDRLSTWRTVPVGGVVVIEGVYTTRAELAHCYDYRVWVDCPRDIRLARGLARDGAAARHTWE